MTNLYNVVDEMPSTLAETEVRQVVPDDERIVDLDVDDDYREVVSGGTGWETAE